MKVFTSAAAVALVCGFAAPANAASIVYIVNTQSGANAVTGSITTNGKTGVLVRNDITDFSLTLSRDGATTGTIDPAAGALYDVAGRALTATSNDILFDFTAITYGNGFFFSNAAFTNYFCGTAGLEYNCGNGLTNETTISAGGVIEATARTGVQSIASVTVSAVPEPATWAMMLIGFGGIGSSMRRRRTSARIQFA